MSKLDTSKLKPGDVVVVKPKIWILRMMIWLQEFLSARSPKYANYGHVAVVHHRDEEGRLWGIEANSHGIGWVLVDKWNGKYGLSNSEQPRTQDTDYKLTSTVESLLGRRYDYSAYLDFALNALGINDHWKDYSGCDVPAHFICSAVADFVYENENLPNPGGFEITRYTTPAAWARFIDKKQWLDA